MRIQALAASILATLALNGPATAQTPEPANQERPVVVYGMWPSVGQCTSENTTSVPFADLLRDREVHHDQCISTEAWISGRALFLDRDDIDRPRSNSSDDASGRRIGIYADEEVWGSIQNAESARVRIVGILWDCKDLQGPNVIMVMGYCHYTGGPIIGVSSVSPMT